ncbi:MAG: NDP-sugar synthase [Candidatus Aureabacteria bacterium]|nr:NDP-sugar synthase [Candidatus Auribacterota bacterium]
MKALILSAGFGTRLRPVTHHIPKPLLPVGNITLLDFHIRRLADAGIKEIVINTHHLHRKVKRYLARSKHKGVRLHVLFEKRILGTGGAIKNAEKILRGSPFVVVNSDVVYDFDLGKIIKAHARSSGIATMVLRETGVKALQRVKIEKGYVVSIGRSFPSEKGRRKLFTGIHVINPDIFRYMPKAAFFCINSDVYRDVLHTKDRIKAYLASGYWQDMGLPENYFAVWKDFLKKKAPKLFYKKMKGKIYRSSYVEKGAAVSREAVLGPNAVLLSGVRVAREAAVRNSILLPGTHVRKGEVVSCQIRYKKSVLSFSHE